ncbi:MAG: trimeric intracellular cation channel family protein [Pontibacterium sp.]
MLYWLGLFSMGIFAVTSVIATQKRNLDIFSVVFLASVAALGGGTLRDIILGNYPIYWVSDLWYLWIAVAVSIAAFFMVQILTHRYTLLLYLDALGVALFSVTAAAKTLNLGYSASIAVVMGIITAIFGGVLRDILSGSPSLLLSKELYATPVLVGLSLFVGLEMFVPNREVNVPLCIGFIFFYRAAAIHYKLQYPKWLCSEAS